MSEASERPARRLQGVVRVRDEDGLRRLSRHPLDFGCRPTVIAAPDDDGVDVPIIGSAEALEAVRADGFDVRVSEVGATRGADVGSGDRFEGGQVVPRGLGRKVRDEES
jgi:hypothetical protein